MTGLLTRPVMTAGPVDSGEFERFAELLAGADAPGLVAQALARADSPDRLPGWAVRAFLSEGMQLGADAASDVDQPVDPGSGFEGDLAARFACSSRLQRGVTLLYWREYHDEGEIAAVLGCSTESVETYLDVVRERLDVGRGRTHTEQDLRRLLLRWRLSRSAEVAPSELFHVSPMLLSAAQTAIAIGPGHDDSPHAILGTFGGTHEYVALESGALGVQPLDTEAFIAEVFDAEAIDAHAIDTEAIESEEVDAHAIDSEPIDAEPIDAEPIDAEPIDAEPIDAEPIDAEPIDAEPIDAEPIDVEVFTPQILDVADTETLRAVHVKAPPPYPSRWVVRPLIALTAVLGLNYLIWRWVFSIHWSAWWIAVPLVLAETYSLVDSMLFGLTMWRLERRAEPGLPPGGATVDVFITTYNEPIDLVMATARAAQQIQYPHTLWILDDGNRAELRELAAAAGIEVISRSADWADMPRHAKAGNLNNALMVTQGEFIVILDADQIPMPELLDRTLGYFRDEKMAIVQTPQFFVNVPESDPLGSQAPLFYGPLQQGKDGWNAAFFCGSNAVLRREALMQMGIRRYVHELELRITDALRTAEKVIRRAQVSLDPSQAHVRQALAEVTTATQRVRFDLDANVSLADATRRFQDRVRDVSRSLVEADVAISREDLDELLALTGSSGEDAPTYTPSPEALDRLSRRDWSPLGAIATVRALIAAVDVDREDEAQPIMPMSTISVTEDMATCMRVHSMGWKSAYHDEVLAVGLAPEDIGTMLTQRLRWAQGTVQVFLRENPFLQKGLSLSQKLMYTATMWSYLSGFAALAYIAAPIIYLVFGVLPVHALSVSFFARLIPFLIVNQVLFFVIGRGRHTWRGQQYSLALFPVWIKAVTSAVGNVAFGRSLSFNVTRKTRLRVEKRPWHLVRPQLVAMALLVVAAGIGIVRLATGQATELGTVINLIWVCFDLLLFSVIPRAVSYRGFEPDTASDDSPQADDPTMSHLMTLLETSR